jgi:hypothetical protein
VLIATTISSRSTEKTATTDKTVLKADLSRTTHFTT